MATCRHDVNCYVLLGLLNTLSCGLGKRCQALLESVTSWLLGNLNSIPRNLLPIHLIQICLRTLHHLEVHFRHYSNIHDCFMHVCHCDHNFCQSQSQIDCLPHFCPKCYDSHLWPRCLGQSWVHFTLKVASVLMGYYGLLSRFVHICNESTWVLQQNREVWHFWRKSQYFPLYCKSWHRFNYLGCIQNLWS